MAGHSKWANIKRRKGAQDAKRGKVFTKLIREIWVAAKEGGPDPEANPRLRLAIQNAKGQNMPKENIQRAIEKGTGGDDDDFESITYEGYAAHGVAIFLECLTDNQNRTVATIRNLFSKAGGNLAKNGSVDYLFDRKGIFEVILPEPDEDLLLQLIDAGAEEAEFQDGYLHITCAMEDFGNMQHEVDSLNLEVENAELQRIPKTTMELSVDQRDSVLKLIDQFEDEDDVQKVFHNLEWGEEQLV
ncbi:YebC/PmpR family DNA-binding transcriptional regulator [Marinoscillum sp.]|uniref:YebC/PmpR family DNA-binding transcriptional regulator n=1 Tax=Marinoscillum sp. TaxID=2024838 RepID=UPI003BA95FDB